MTPILLPYRLAGYNIIIILHHYNVALHPITRSARYDISNVITGINITQAGVCHVIATRTTQQP